eukprot:scaffold16140_cov212-Cylindrotheca_fusiformis.AAC.2
MTKDNPAQGEKKDLHPLAGAYQTYLKHDNEEKNHFDDVTRSFRQHATFAMSQWANQQYRLHALPESMRDVLPNTLKQGTPEFNLRSSQYKDAAIKNQFCLDCILRHAGVPHSQQITSMPKIASDEHISKVSSVLKSLARDWSTDGRVERDMAYKPLLSQVERYIPITGGSSSSKPSVCVPGAGVGRLAFELTKLGYSVQGNEFSLHMLLASDFILNGGIATPNRPLEISPWLMESRNLHSPADQCRIVKVPDVDPLDIMNTDDGAAEPQFSMAAGDFQSIYSNPREAGQWDCVCSCFFLDACPNIVESIQLIHKMLKPGGYLMNFGPLLYHWSGPAMRPDDLSVEAYQNRCSYLDPRYLSSVDLSYEDVIEIVRKIGFEIVEEQVGVKSLYTADRRSMQNMVYRCVNFVARKLPIGDKQPGSPTTEKKNTTKQ